jgi:hypothetical protein
MVNLVNKVVRLSRDTGYNTPCMGLEEREIKFKH